MTYFSLNREYHHKLTKEHHDHNIVVEQLNSKGLDELQSIGLKILSQSISGLRGFSHSNLAITSIPRDNFWLKRSFGKYTESFFYR